MGKCRTWLRVLAFAVPIAVVACATGAGPSQPAKSQTAAGESAQRDTFLWLRNIDGFNTIDDEHIVLSSGTKHALVKTFGRCYGLRYAETIAIDAPLGYLDRSGVGHIVYRRGFGDTARCPIDRLVAVKDRKEARALVEKESAEKAARQ
jgi:hypothetical protein